MFKLLNLTNWLTGLVESFTFYGGGKGGSSSSSETKDFFGVGKRAPYEELLSALLLGGTIGGTEGYYTGGTSSNRGGGGGYNGGGYNPAMAGMPGFPGGPSLQGNRKNTNQGTYVPGTPGMSIGDYIRQTPGYQFGFDTGLEALNRNFAATGVGQTGAQSVALQNYGNQYAGQALQQLISNLQPAAGVGITGVSSQSQSSPGLGGVFGTIAGIGMSMMGNPFAVKGLGIG
jgi:hypothetical protein